MGVNIPVGFGMASLVYQRDGAPRESISTFAYDPPSLSPTAHADTIYGLMTNASGPGIPTRIQTGWSFMGVRVTEQDDPGPLQGEHIAQQVGLGSAGALTPNVAVLIRKFTASGGRRNRGRMFVPPVWPPETNVSPNGAIAGTQLGDLQNWWEFVRAGMTTAGLPIVLLHSQVPFTPTPVTSISVQAIVATQRRRLRR